MYKYIIHIYIYISIYIFDAFPDLRRLSFTKRKKEKKRPLNPVFDGLFDLRRLVHHFVVDGHLLVVARTHHLSCVCVCVSLLH